MGGDDDPEVSSSAGWLDGCHSTQGPVEHNTQKRRSLVHWDALTKECRAPGSSEAARLGTWGLLVVRGTNTPL